MKKLMMVLSVVFMLVACSQAKETETKATPEVEAFNIMVEAKEEGRMLTQDEAEKVHEVVTTLKGYNTTEFDRWVEIMFNSYGNEERFAQAKEAAEKVK